MLLKNTELRATMQWAEMRRESASRAERADTSVTSRRMGRDAVGKRALEVGGNRITREKSARRAASCTVAKMNRCWRCRLRERFGAGHGAMIFEESAEYQNHGKQTGADWSLEALERTRTVSVNENYLEGTQAHVWITTTAALFEQAPQIRRVQVGHAAGWFRERCLLWPYSRSCARRHTPFTQEGSSLVAQTLTLVLR